jgi:hypothetical protein
LPPLATVHSYGWDTGVNALEFAEYDPVPTLLTAATRKI